jgi:hypothetical protein
MQQVYPTEWPQFITATILEWKNLSPWLVSKGRQTQLSHTNHTAQGNKLPNWRRNAAQAKQ